MRLFIAAELPDKIIEALAETSALLRGCVRGRFIAPDLFHVTLAFLGDVASTHINCVVEALEASCCGTEAFDVALGEFGSFGRRSQATLWQGFRDAGSLPDMAGTVRNELRIASLSFDDKPFLPHITLMRAADLANGTLPMPTLASGRIDAVTLFQSDLSGERPAYEPLHTVSCNLHANRT